MQPIKNIIFDLGGIFLNIDYPKTEKAFIDMGVTHFPTLYTQHHASDIFELLETGKITPGEFYEGFREASGVTLTDEQIHSAWNAMLLDFPVERIEWLEGIKDKYKVFLFSNTNRIHYDVFREIYRKDTGRQDFDSNFIKAYYSHDLGLRKPYPESFRKILEEQGLLAGETLFIDDTVSNIEGAKKAGLQTIHLVPPSSVLQLDL
ncbi:HAD family hydrolase [Foetidibacter luteolus]|uniref:HAD family hydrolase n=1 Tax=Foetidibacter luteolus TaxID=2608880 RepID=UPI00129BF2FD|nr:HAD family phosphatase [Foetidibacter luteolus]